jgi:hypothetical protein
MMYHQDATFAVLAGWFQRFDRGPGMATPFYQLVNELDEVKKGDKPGWSYQNYLEMIEPWYEIWHVEGNVGWVGSPKAILNGWDILPIVLYQ